MRIGTHARNRARFGSVNQAAAFMFVVVDRVFAEFGELARLTSVREGVHSEFSRHYWEGGWDFGARGMSLAKCKKIEAELQLRLGPDFNVIYEHHGGKPKRHFHVGFKPRRS